jgi:hypothetical protein
MQNEQNEKLTNESIINKSTSNKIKAVNIILQNLNQDRFNNFNDWLYLNMIFINHDYLHARIFTFKIFNLLKIPLQD